MSELDVAAWVDQYRSELGEYESCASKLESLFRDLLSSAGIDVVAIESRAKDPESLQRKVDAKGDTYQAPLQDVTDLIGVRVIAYYLEDVERIGEIVEREFVVDEENSNDKLDDLGANRFGYRSVHYVVTLADQRARLAEWSGFREKKAEIQVRTATQHAWAAVEHKLNYKRTTEAPRDLRRKLMRLSALFELADEQFSAVRDGLGEVEARYISDIKLGNLELPIDTASLEAFISASEVVQNLVSISLAGGVTIAGSEEEGYRERLDRDLRDLAWVLEFEEFETIAEFEEILRGALANRAQVDRLISGYKAEFEDWRSVADMLTLVVGIQRELPIELFHVIYDENVCKILEAINPPAS